MSNISGEPAGPVRSWTSRARSEDESGDEVEDCIDERIRRENGEEAVNNSAACGLTNRRDASIDSEPFVRGDNGDDEREQDRLGDADCEVGGGERGTDLLEIVPRVEAEEERRPD